MIGHLRFYLLRFLSLVLCGQKSIDFQFDSSDYVTAGFSEISLQLNSNKKANLIFGKAKQVGGHAGGGIYKWDRDTVRGQWKIKDNLIFVSFESKAKSVENIFIEKRFKARGQKIINETTLAFPTQADSVIITDIPCLKVRK